MKKTQKNSFIDDKIKQYKALQSKKMLLVMIIIVSVLCINLVSSFEFDNIKSYDSINREITIKNSFLGFPTSDVATVKLINYSQYCFAESCYAYYELNSNEKGLALKSSKYYDASQRYEKEGKISTYEIFDPTSSYEVPVYSRECKLELNKTSGKEENFCTQIENGKETKYGLWINYDPLKELEQGRYLLREKVDVKSGETVDVVPNFYGVEINEWVLFTGMTRYEYYNTGDDNSEWAYAGYITYQSFSIGNVSENTNIQVKGVSVKFTEFSGSGTGGNTIYYTIYPATNLTNCSVNTVTARGYLTGDFQNQNAWWNITGTLNGTLTANSIYCLQINSTFSSNAGWRSDRTSATYEGGMVYNQDDNWRPATDAMFEIWGVSASAIVINSPPDNYNSQYGNITFDANISSGNGLINASLFDNSTGVWKINQTKIISGSTNNTIFQNNYSNGTVLWSEQFCDGVGCYFSDNRTFEIHTIPPVITIYTPKGDQGIVTIPYNVTLNYTASDEHLQSCWYNSTFNATKTYVTCNATQKVSVPNTNTQTIYIYANDSFGNVNFNSTSFYASVSENSIIYNTPVLQLSSQDYYLNMTYNSNLAYLYSIFYYNGTNISYATTQYNADNNLFIKSSYSIPSTTLGSKNFLWETFFSNSSGSIFIYNSSTSTQVVSAFNIGNCSSYTENILNYFLKDEQNQSDIKGNIEINLQIYPINSNLISVNFSQVFSNISNASICLQNPLNSSSFSLYTQVKYYSTGYVTRHNYFQNFIVTNSSTPKDVNLFDLISSSATEFVITYKNNYYQPVPGALINIQKKYIGEDAYKTVEIELTDSHGTATGYFDLVNNAIYSISVTKDGVLFDTFIPITLYCVSGQVCSINLNNLIPDIPPTEFVRHGNVDWTIRSNRTLRTEEITFSTSDSSVSNFTMIINNNDMYENITLCSNSLLTSAGTLLCNIPTSQGNKSFVINFYQDGNRIGLLYDSFEITAKQLLGGNTAILLLVLILTLPMMFIPSLIWTLIAGAFAVLISILLLYVGGFSFAATTFFGWFIVAAIILIWKLNKQGQS